MLSVSKTSAAAFPDYLRQLRKKRTLSLGQLALRSGVNKSTLSRWESGASLPRITELSQVLDTLAVSASDRACCLRLLDAPRAVLALRSSDPSLACLSLGDLLYGLRQRAGISQEEVARAAGVSRALYGQWEGDLVQPAADKLHAVAFALGATTEEVAALSCRPLSQTPVASDRDVLIAQYMALMPWHDGVGAASYNLHLLSLLGHLGRLVRQRKADIADIALIIADMGEWVSLWSDDTDTYLQYLQRSLELATRSAAPLHFHMVSPIAVLHSRQHSALPFKQRLSGMLNWQSCFKSREGKAYLLSFIAGTIAEEAPEQALRLAEEYCALVADNPDEYPCRLRDKGNLLYKCGMVSQSVTFIATLTPQDDFRAVLQQFEMARGLIALGSLAEARSCLDRGSQIMNESSPVFLRTKRDELEKAFAHY